MIAIRECRVAAQSEFFAEIGVPARFFAGQASTIIPSLTGGLNGVNDSCVTRAAAEMTRKALFDSLAIPRAPSPQHGGSTNHNPGEPEAALNSPVEDKGLT